MRSAEAIDHDCTCIPLRRSQLAGDNLSSRDWCLRHSRTIFEAAERNGLAQTLAETTPSIPSIHTSRTCVPRLRLQPRRPYFFAMGWQETLSWPRLLIFLGLVFFLLTLGGPFAQSTFAHPKSPNESVVSDIEDWCPLPGPAITANDGLASSSLFLGEPSLQLQLDRLSAAVNVSTVVYRDSGNVDTDTRWETFGRLHEVLRELFPKV